jgi:hypothetical protein
MLFVFFSLLVSLVSVYFTKSCGLTWEMRRSSHPVRASLFSYLIAVLYVSVSRGLHRPSLIVLQFAIGQPHPRPLHQWHQQTDSLAGNTRIAIRYRLTDNVVRKNQLPELEPVVSLISWLPPQVSAKLNVS